MENSPLKTTSILRHVLLRVLPFFVPVLLFAFFSTYLYTYNTIKEQEQEAIEAELLYAQKTIEDRIQTTEDWLKNLSFNSMIVNSFVDPQGAGEYIPQFFKSLRIPRASSVGQLFLINFRGDVIAANNVQNNAEISGVWLNDVLDGNNYEKINKDGLIIAEPITINGLPEGALVLMMEADGIKHFLELSSSNGIVSILDENNTVIFTSDAGENNSTHRSFDRERYDGWFISSKKIYSSSNLKIQLKQNPDIAFKALYDVEYALIAMIVLSVIGIVFSLSMSAQIFSTSIFNVVEKIRDLRIHKDMSNRIEVSKIKELSKLEIAYNQLVEELENTIVSKDYIDDLFEALPLPVFVVSKNGDITKTNQIAFSSFAAHRRLNHISDIFSEDVFEEHKKKIYDAFTFHVENITDILYHYSRHEDDTEIEINLLISENITKPFIISITALRGINETVSGYIITATDIEDRKHKEKEIIELAEQNTLMARAIEEIDLGITISDGTKVNNPLIFCNNAFYDISGRTKKEVIGFNCSFLQGPETNPATVKKLSGAIKKREAITVEILNYKKNGEKFWNELSLNPIFSKDGKLKYYVGIQNDITQRKQIEEMKKEFIATVSHELRTPLTSIHGSLGLLQDIFEMGGDVEERELVQIAYRNSERLKSLVDDILDTEKLESGEMRFRIEAQSLKEIIYHSIDLNKPFGERYNVVFKIKGSIPDIHIDLDKNRIVQVFANLLSNAAKFSTSGDHVDIETEIVDNMVRISVIDYGQGISDEFRNNLFKKFSQEDSSDTRKLQGTGLGLYISKKIIDAHGGKINFKSEKGNGTTFYFELPLKHKGLINEKRIENYTYH